MSLKLIAAKKTDVGQQREQNEDNADVFVTDDGEAGLFIVADGMGGYQAGEVASRIAVEKIRDALKHLLVPVYDQPTIRLAPISEQETIQLNQVGPGSEDNDATIQLDTTKRRDAPKTRKLPESAGTRAVEDQLKAAIRQANKAILTYGEEHSGARGLGCTLTMALIQNGQAHIANIGDSRTYLLRNGELQALTKDHSLVAKLVETKQISPDDIYTHPQRNLIYHSLGAGHKHVDPDVFHETLRPGDRLLLCSDGLWEMVRSPALLKALSGQDDVEKICDHLIDLANANGGEDNISAVVVRVS
ncbi:MAG TPA: PP2C family serine/threonine-protein phosphatase [Ktedonobacteraceae bacterium]|nr:PP2C family serine/threonine-protein phosphatase [Ktedonobacteraceae bacterium]